MPGVIWLAQSPDWWSQSRRDGSGAEREYFVSEVCKRRVKVELESGIAQWRVLAG